MIYMECKDGRKIIVLESENIDAIKSGRPAVSPDGSILISWTPDMVWLADKLMDTNGDGQQIGKLIDESCKRPHRTGRKYHEPHVHKFGE